MTPVGQHTVTGYMRNASVRWIAPVALRVRRRVRMGVGDNRLEAKSPVRNFGEELGNQIA